jgi:hypothetical protein
MTESGVIINRGGGGTEANLTQRTTAGNVRKQERKNQLASAAAENLREPALVVHLGAEMLLRCS